MSPTARAGEGEPVERGGGWSDFAPLDQYGREADSGRAANQCEKPEPGARVVHFRPTSSSTAADMAVTPVLMVGSGTGRYRLE
jgi:hypothetical protein